ncbi:Imm8 family immunity protein [Microvirga sp. 2TAF3]|uniref:Imm8 family immunity protein n=1 Tax=Microvirga sp. 2TAF3 TaxID=3233014 RepID=UPI003F9986E8
MRAELKDIYSPDVDVDNFVPERKDTFAIFVQIFVGPERVDAYDSFDCYICSPNGIQNIFKGEDILIGEPLIIAHEYDFKLIRNRIDRYCSSCTGYTWQDIVPKLLRLGKWEFENYQPFNKQV